MSTSVSVSELSTLRHVTLDVGGMTCASCVRRVEKALSRVDGVRSAEVNLATEKASVAFDPSSVTVDALTAAVGKAGYTIIEHVAPGSAISERVAPGGAASPTAPAPSATPPDGDAPRHDRDAEIARLRRQW